MKIPTIIASLDILLSLTAQASETAIQDEPRTGFAAGM
jgi:hypothetical protein